MEGDMRVLVTWASKRGGTEGIARAVSEVLQANGFEVVAASVEDVGSIAGFDAVIVGGALYANRWPAAGRRFVSRHVRELRNVPVWFFSSGPLHNSADVTNIPPTPQVIVLAERVGAKGHVTFGGRLEPDAKGFPASAMAKNHAGDWRNLGRIRDWASEVAKELPNAVPGRPVDHPARSVTRLLTHGFAGWALCALTMLALLRGMSITWAVVLHAVAAPVIFAAIATHYFRPRGAREPLPVALSWAIIVAVLDWVVIAGVVQRDFSMFQSVVGTWLPFLLILLVTWATGVMISMMPASLPRAGSADAYATGTPNPKSM
jgi:menaquinone-dependent protoporphyrinogen oxidase